MYTHKNYFLKTKGKFKGCKRPKRNPDYTSKYRGRVSSEYWYGTDSKGPYVVRDSTHWSGSNHHETFCCQKIASCYWWLTTNGKSNFTCGKIYLSSLKKNK